MDMLVAPLEMQTEPVVPTLARRAAARKPPIKAGALNGTGRSMRVVDSVQCGKTSTPWQDEMQFAATVFENSLNGIMVTAADGTIVKVNNAFTTITGYSAAEAIGRTARLLKSGVHDRTFYRKLWETLHTHSKWEGEIVDRRKNGEPVLLWQSISVVRDSAGRISGYVANFSDISEQRAAAERVRQMAHYDLLTGLPNRALLQDRCEQALQRAQLEQSRFAMLLLDLDRFKHINDSLGHPLGDSLLRAVAERLRQALREQHTVARLGGDEFVVILEPTTSKEEVEVAAAKILAAFSAPFAVQDHVLSMATTIGISMYPDHGTDVTTLLKSADLALYRAKETGGGCFQFFETHLHDLANARLQLENELHHALKRGELTLQYQPQYALEDGRLIGAEALLRWNNPYRGWVPPEVFIPVAESTGLIVPIGAWALEQACRQARAWRDAGLDLSIAVNLSGVQIHRGDIVNTVARVLASTGLPAACLELEISETFIMGHGEHDMQQFDALRALGVSLAIDDFGTGQSSLGYLKRLPVSKLKIDRSFMTDIASDPNSATIMRAILGLGHGLQLTVVAEGVETLEQENFLREQHCDHVQGFRYSRPIDALAFTALALHPVRPIPDSARRQAMQRHPTLEAVCSCDGPALRRPRSPVGADDYAGDCACETRKRRPSALEEDILGIADRERDAISRDLHDGLGQELTGIALMMRRLAIRLRNEAPGAVDEVNAIIKQVNHSIESTRSLVRGLLPCAGGAGLPDALRRLGSRCTELYGFDVNVHIDGEIDGSLDNTTADQLFRIAQEALTNAARHGHASRVEMTLAMRRDRWGLRIADDGVGIGIGGETNLGMGLKIMQYRAGRVGAQLEIGPNERRGTVVRVSALRAAGALLAEPVRRAEGTCA